MFCSFNYLQFAVTGKVISHPVVIVQFQNRVAILILNSHLGATL